MNYEHWIVYQMKEEKRIFPFMYISLRKFMIMIAKNNIEFRFRLFWDTLYIIIYININVYEISIQSGMFMMLI